MEGKSLKARKWLLLLNVLLIICKKSAHLWEETRLLTSHNRMFVAASSSTLPLSVSYTLSCPNLLHKQPHLIWSSLSISELREVFQWLHLCGLSPEKLPVGHFCPHYSSLCVCVSWMLCASVFCSPVASPLGPDCGAAALKRTAASLAPLMCHGQATLLCSHFPSLSSSPSSSRLSRSLSLRFLLFIGWCRSRTTNQFQSLSQWGLTGPICLPSGQ